jgi:ligand-binding sensor domain-containing protein
VKALITIFLVIFFTIFKGNTQEYNYYHYDIKDGLSGITVYSIAQDKDGFLWIATASGLSRFDGTSFKNYGSNEGLNDNEIISLFVDSKNRVWIFPFKSSIYYYYQGKIHNSSNDTLLRKFNLKNEIFKASEDKDGNIFFLVQQKIYVLSKDDNLNTINNINGEPFYCDGCGRALDGNSRFFICFNKNLVLRRINVFTYNNSVLVDNGVLDNCNFSRNTFEINPYYIVTQNGLYFDINDLRKKRHSSIKVPDHFHNISYINDTLFTISTVEKTFLYNVNKSRIADSFLLNKLVNNCFEDKEKDLWFATQNQGLYRLSSLKYKIYKLEDNFNAFPVGALSRYNQLLYIGGPKYLLWKLDLTTNKLEKIDIKTNIIINQVTAIKAIDSSTILVSGNIGYCKINNGKLAIRLMEVSVKDFLLYNDSIIAATDRAVFQFPFNYTSLDTIWKSRATCVYRISDEYYIGTLNGLYAVKKSAEQSITNEKDSLLLVKDKIIAISQSSDGDIWVATESSGLICLHNDKIVYQLTTKDGLLSNLCRCLYIEGNAIWIGTNKGISKLDISHTPFSVTNFTEADGLDCEIINCIYAKGDSVYAGTPFGISFFRDRQIENSSLCSLKLLDITSTDSDWYDKQNNIHLSSNDDLLRFEYAGISFRSEGNITYYYQLKGLDTSWQTTNQNVVSYQALPSGDYQFNMYAVNKYGVKSNSVFVHFSKAKTFWELTIVRIAILLLVAAIIWFIIKTRISAIETKANESIQRERKINEIEQMALRSQMNPHFIFNSINSIQQYVFAGDVIEANRFITNFSSLVRQTLYISGKKFITVGEEIEYIKAYLNLEKIKYENVFDFTVIVENDVDNNIPVPPLILQPFIENSIRHGVLNLESRQGNILLHFFVEESNHLICIVEDNGIGRKSAMKLKSHILDHQSKGMELVNKRINGLNAIYNTDISVIIEDIEQDNVTGTRVKIKLPLKYDE